MDAADDGYAKDEHGRTIEVEMHHQLVVLTPEEMAHKAAQREAMRLVHEEVLDDLIEAGNGLDLDDAWRDETIRNLVDARDKPAIYLARANKNARAGTASPAYAELNAEREAKANALVDEFVIETCGITFEQLCSLKKMKGGPHTKHAEDLIALRKRLIDAITKT